MTALAEVQLWGRTIGAVALEDGHSYAAFQYDPAFSQSGIEVSPITLPLSDRVYVFSQLPQKTFRGLPGLLADSLPDRFGDALIDAWLATQGRAPESFNAVERLCYTGARGMGALEFVPSIGPKQQRPGKIEIDALVRLASEVLTQRSNLKATFSRQGKAAGFERHPPSRYIGWRRTGQGSHCLEPSHKRSTLRPDCRWGGLRLLAVEIRRCGRQQRQGTRRS